MNTKVDNLVKAAHAQFAVTPIEAVKSISAAPPSNQTYPPVKIKHPSKLFKHVSPSNQTTTGHSPSGNVHFVNTITISSKPDQTDIRQSTMEEKGDDGEATSEESDKPEPNTITSVIPEVRNELEEEGEARAKILSSPSRDPKGEFEEDTTKAPDETAEEREDNIPNIFRIPCTVRKKFMEGAYINPDLPINAMSLSLYNEAFPQQATYEGHNMVGTIKKAPIEVGRFVFDIELTIFNDMSTITGPTSTDLVLGRPFVEATEVILNYDDGSALFTDGVRRVVFKNGVEEVYEYEPSTMGNMWGLQGRRPGRIKRRDPSNLKYPA